MTDRKRKDPSKVFRRVLSLSPNKRLDHGKGSWVAVSAALLFDKQLGPAERDAYVRLRCLAGAHNRMSYGLSRLSDLLDCSRATLSRWLVKLEKRGLVYRHARPEGTKLTLVFAPLKDVYGEEADAKLSFGFNEKSAAKAHRRSTCDEPISNMRRVKDEADLDSDESPSLETTCEKTEENVAIQDPGDRTHLKSETPPISNLRHPHLKSETGPPYIVFRKASYRKAKREKDVEPTTRRSDQDQVEGIGASLTKASTAKGGSKAESGFREKDSDSAPSHPKPRRRDRSSGGLFAVASQRPAPARPARPIPPTSSASVFAAFKDEVQKRWPTASVPVNMTGKVAGRLNKEIVRVYEPTDVIEMIRVLVWDWESIRGAVWPYRPSQPHPCAENLADYASTLVGCIGKGHTGDAEHRVSKYRERYHAVATEDAPKLSDRRAASNKIALERIKGFSKKHG